MPKLIAGMFSTGWLKILNGLMGIIRALVPLGPAFVLKDKSKQVVLFILDGIYLWFV